MHKLHGLLDWCIRQVGVNLIQVCERLEDGFEKVLVKSDSTFYGINSDLSWKDISDIESAEMARNRGYLSTDYSDAYFDRSRRIALDMQQRSKQEGFEFYNGKLARLKAIAVQSGESPSTQVLELNIGCTSYFTALGTNIHFGGYKYLNFNMPDEPPLQESLNWPLSSNWPVALAQSPLANQLAVHLFLYNDSEILYVRRGQVGQDADLWHTTVNGVMEFKEDNPDIVNGNPNIGSTASRETKYELNINISAEDIRWLGLCATLNRCEPFVVGVCRITDTKEQIAKKALLGKEHRELSEKSRNSFRKKEICAIPLSFDKYSVELNLLGILTLPIKIPYPLGLQVGIRNLIQKKIINKQERRWFQSSGLWSDSGAASLLLCLAHLSNREKLCNILEKLREGISKKRGNSLENSSE